MTQLFDSFWRAVAYCMHPRVIGLSFLPLVLMVALSFGLGYFGWDMAVQAVSDWLQAWSLVQSFLGWLDGVGLGYLRTVFAPLVVLVLATPVIVLLSLLLVAIFMTPAMVDLVGEDEAIDPARLASLLRIARADMPAAGDYDQAEPWAGLRPATPGGEPIVGDSGIPGLWLNLGHGALGFTFACGTAQLLAQRMSGQATDIPLHGTPWTSAA